MTDPNALHGDGLNFPFFNLLWSKNSNDKDERQVKSSDIGRENKKRAGKSGERPPILRVPDTVVFLFGQPHQWYFTSKNGGPDKNKTTILRKRRANITLANIEEVFFNKAASRNVGDDDLIAYFISSNENSEEHASLDACNTTVNNKVACNIEYFNKKALHEFLQNGRSDKSGILQRFVAPHGGGRHNSQIRAIWTPKLCILERRRTKQELRDTRFALYERAITFDGPDVHSVLVPLRGTVLAGRVENICNEIVKHIADVAAENTHGCGKENAFHGIARMVVNFKVDGNGKIWILWSNSIRLRSAAVAGTKLTESDSYSSMQATASSQPLNMETVVRLPSSAKLTQAPNHVANMKLDNKLMYETCPSCNKHDANPHFQPVPFKTIIQHFEKTLEMLEATPESRPSKIWPPEDRFIKAAGGVGFGSLPAQFICDREINPKRKFSEETHVIPPVIRQIHPKLRAKGYSIYRNDPLFLLKTCNVCEDCFLAYAELTSTSFIHMVQPIEPFETNKEYHFEFPNHGTKSKPCNDGKKRVKGGDQEAIVFGKDFGSAPELPAAIVEAPKTDKSEPKTPLQPKETLYNTLPTFFPPSTVDAEKKLGHMIKSHKMLVDSEKIPVEKSQNPYAENLAEQLIG